MLEIRPLTAIGEIHPGSDLVSILAGALTALGLIMKATDILVVTQKIISKAENCYVALESVTPGSEALRLAGVTCKDPRIVELVLKESTAVVRAVAHVLITRHRSGFVMANAGIDCSNTGGTQRVLLLPRDADASAERLRQGLGALFETSR